MSSSITMEQRSGALGLEVRHEAVPTPQAGDAMALRSRFATLPCLPRIRVVIGDRAPGKHYSRVDIYDCFEASLISP